ncbi:hypothetical protein DBT_2033 [Dissulfuribacter thermophilus]|uniref:Uncharacterized protein n=1 Tax=Dissulfuribacter thermophilus TaxID=1156395 RepID=A0A1B9F3J2_9BACT|nr:hypothetical protein DBT_2033 [Dissulfuribacter thermophilus]
MARVAKFSHGYGALSRIIREALLTGLRDIGMKWRGYAFKGRVSKLGLAFPKATLSSW